MQAADGTFWDGSEFLKTPTAGWASIPERLSSTGALAPCGLAPDSP